MNYRVRILRPAQRDLAEIAAYLTRECPNVADGLVDELLQRIGSLAELPHRGARPADRGLRAREIRFVPEGRYLIFYKIRPRTVQVLRVLHTRRAYRNIL